MKTNALEKRERATAGKGSKAQQGVLLAEDAWASNRIFPWTPEDIAGPEPWTLDSFSDLLPHESV